MILLPFDPEQFVHALFAGQIEKGDQEQKTV